MPTYRQGNMLDVATSVDHFLITTNAIVKRNGALVMGAGLAKVCRDMTPGVIDWHCGQAILNSGFRSYCLLLNVYGRLGLFQVKHHYKDVADVNLITESTKRLAAHAERHPELTYALNFPGIGNGKLAYDTVKPIVDSLPTNVQVWTFD